MTIQFDTIRTDERGERDRYQTDWTVGEERFRVSSVNNSYTTETLIFRILPSGESDMFDVWGDKHWRCTQNQHREFLSEFVENRTQEG